MFEQFRISHPEYSQIISKFKKEAFGGKNYNDSLVKSIKRAKYQVIMEESSYLKKFYTPL